MLDLTTEIQIQQLVPLAAETGAFNGTGIPVATINTGDLDIATLTMVLTTGTGTVVVQLQGSQTLSGTYANLAPTPLMPNTAFPAQAATTTTPVVLPIDPRGLPPFIRAAVTVTGSVSAFTTEILFLSRPLQVGFNANSG